MITDSQDYTTNSVNTRFYSKLSQLEPAGCCVINGLYVNYDIYLFVRGFNPKQRSREAECSSKLSTNS